MIKIACLGLVTIFLSSIAGSIKREYGIAVALGASLILAMYGLSSLSSVIEKIRKFESEAGIDERYLTILFRLLGIAYLTQLVVNLCRDSGNTAVAAQVGIVGKISMLLVSFPVLQSLVLTLGELFG